MHAEEAAQQRVASALGYGQARAVLMGNPQPYAGAVRYYAGSDVGDAVDDLGSELGKRRSGCHGYGAQRGATDGASVVKCQ